MTDGEHTADHHLPHGSIGEEAVRLAEAVQGWLGERSGRTAGDAWAAATAPGAFESPECRVCPICRAMQFVTTVQPGVLAHLADAATSFAAAVRAMGESESRGAESRATESRATEPPESPFPSDQSGEE